MSFLRGSLHHSLMIFSFKSELIKNSLFSQLCRHQVPDGSSPFLYAKYKFHHDKWLHGLKFMFSFGEFVHYSRLSCENEEKEKGSSHINFPGSTENLPYVTLFANLDFERRRNETKHGGIKSHWDNNQLLLSLHSLLGCALENDVTFDILSIFQHDELIWWYTITREGSAKRKFHNLHKKSWRSVNEKNWMKVGQCFIILCEVFRWVLHSCNCWMTLEGLIVNFDKILWSLKSFR